MSKTIFVTADDAVHILMGNILSSLLKLLDSKFLVSYNNFGLFGKNLLLALFSLPLHDLYIAFPSESPLARDWPAASLS